jgi:hypothetical protein
MGVGYFCDETSPEDLPVLLLYVLSTRVLWHGEARHLETESSPEFFEPTARNDLAGGFFVFWGTWNSIEIT